MNIRLKRLYFENFKGFNPKVFGNQCFEIDGKNADFFGTNETGKTTVKDGYSWLFTDRDSRNTTKFDIKPIDPDTEQIIHRIDSVAGAILLLDEDEIEIKKVFKENWVTRRGSINDILDGHTTDYYYDTTMMKTKKDYDAKLDEIIDAKIFKMLTDPLYFIEEMHWTDRRDLIIKICGDVENEYIFDLNPDLAALADGLKRRTIDEYREHLNSRLSGLKKQKSEIPIQIKENQRMIPDLSGIDFQIIQDDIKGQEAVIEEANKDIAALKSGTYSMQLAKDILQIETQMIAAANMAKAKNEEIIGDFRNKMKEAEYEQGNVSHETLRLDGRLRQLKDELSYTQNEIKSLKAQWIAVNNQEFQISLETICPACGQNLPGEKIEAARQAALEKFNLKKSKELESLDNKALTVLKPKEARQLEDIEAIEKKISQNAVDVEIADKALAASKKAYEEAMNKTIDVYVTDEYKQLQKSKADIEIQKKQAEDETFEKIKELEALISQSRESIREKSRELGKKDIPAQIEARIEELKKEEVDLANKELELMREFQLTDQFIEAKVNIMDARVADHFKYTRFKMFNRLVNGGIEPCCEVIKKGVSDSSLNYATRVNAGIDCINTLSEYYGITAPIFVDDADLIVSYTPTKSQMICFHVRAEEKKLRFEREV